MDAWTRHGREVHEERHEEEYGRGPLLWSEDEDRYRGQGEETRRKGKKKGEEKEAAGRPVLWEEERGQRRTKGPDYLVYS